MGVKYVIFLSGILLVTFNITAWNDLACLRPIKSTLNKFIHSLYAQNVDLPFILHFHCNSQSYQSMNE